VEDVVITITDLPGNIIKKFSMTDLPPGKHSYMLDASKLEAGCYLYTLSTKDYSTTKQMVLVK